MPQRQNAATVGEPIKIKPFRPDELPHLLSHVDAAWRHPDCRRDIDRWWITEGYPLNVLAQWMARVEPLRPGGSEALKAE